MLCPKCNSVNKFKRDGKAVYCIEEIKGSICGYTLTAEEKKEFFNRKDYRKRYYRRKEKKYLQGISLSEIAIIKFCDYDTVLKNIKQFDILPGIKPIRVEFNKKVLDWVADK